MIVVGGIYYEQCIAPEWNSYYGSGGRAAAALSGFGEPIVLHAFAPLEQREQMGLSLQTFGFEIVFYNSEASFAFSYFHPLSRPTYYAYPQELVHKSTFAIEGDVILRFGFMEGNAKVSANYAVYDPQSPSPELFSQNGSRANHLAYVLNRSELAALFPGQDYDSAAKLLLRKESAEVALIKGGVFGVRVITSSGITANVPAYETTSVFKIGSGDVFSAAFAYYWGVGGRSATDAARLASQSAAWYCDTRSLPLPEEEILSALSPVTGTSPRQIYLAAPFFTLAQRWIVEEVRNALLGLGALVFSPVHDIGFGEPEDVAQPDLKALDESAVILALADGVDLGTIFEVGYGLARGKTILVYSERCLNISSR